MSDDGSRGEPVEIANTPWRHEAEMLAGLLEDAGIDAFVMADDAGGMYPGVGLGFLGRGVGAHVMVRAEDAERAREVLSGIDWDSFEIDEET